MKSVSPRDDEYNTAKVAAYRLLLAQLNDDTDAMSIVDRELEPELLERPDRMRNVLGVMLGVASSLLLSRHERDRSQAIEELQPKLQKAIDALHSDDA
ncbi:hypothetical protein TS71_20695 [Mycolicibacterium neoaurum]|uniref:Uncharacterized protein n=1 Tax=Mycolicibacterium neoaurum VKM Ac-1815D TaxID=700508 RepID=V5XIW5_MYCNE|nr:hypothetical protein D174_04200 [Mycolicibacterium neoaurum VKM Ac-1815D]AMO04508.1 hypothetical protein MyAD_04115 [Mycolicibacterium neoaurum]AXK77203.1 hypothetical protein DXK33_21010 [Mycolicibacterium neoaurum]KJQ48531.1 hypothetical protein TS71_20695 [Mycolicibacterium neoaurum]KUM06918.1 hypothetical protein AVZ31_18865 [Mycolicibacterium neoaurum]